MKIDAIQIGKTYVNKKGQKRTVVFIGQAPVHGAQTVQYYRDRTKECCPNVTSLQALAAWAKMELK